MKYNIYRKRWTEPEEEEGCVESRLAGVTVQLS